MGSSRLRDFTIRDERSDRTGEITYVEAIRGGIAMKHVDRQESLIWPSGLASSATTTVPNLE